MGVGEWDTIGPNLSTPHPISPPQGGVVEAPPPLNLTPIGGREGRPYQATLQETFNLFRQPAAIRPWRLRQRDPIFPALRGYLEVGSCRGQ